MLCAGLVVLETVVPLFPAAAAAAAAATPADPTPQQQQHSILGKMRQLLGGSKQGECGPLVHVTKGRVTQLRPCKRQCSERVAVAVAVTHHSPPVRSAFPLSLWHDAALLQQSPCRPCRPSRMAARTKWQSCGS
jgi:hypothetical protein